MKRVLAISAPMLLALGAAGCVSGAAPDYVATASIPTQSPSTSLQKTGRAALEQRIAAHARAQKVPESLIHAIVRRESNYNPACRNGPYWGLMQIRRDTARSMGYTGSAAGLLDAETNLTYAVAYLANAYRVAQGNERRAVQLYAGGYYYEAKRRGLLGELHPAPDPQEISTASTDIASAQ